MKFLIAALLILPTALGFLVGCIIHPFKWGYQGADEKLEELLEYVLKRRGRRDK